MAQHPIQSVRRAIDVLSCFGPDTPHLTAATVAERLGMNRSTAWRYLNSLTYAGIVLELGRTGEFALGPRTLQLAEVYTSQWHDLTMLASNVLVSLRDATTETAALHVKRSSSRLVISQVESLHELRRTYREIGEPIPLDSGAPSLAILAWLDEPELERYLDSRTDKGSSRRSELEDGLARIRERGYAVSIRARTTNIGSVAAPIFAPGGGAFASINVSGPAERFDLEAIENRLAPEVIHAARTITERLAGTGSDATDRQSSDHAHDRQAVGS